MKTFFTTVLIGLSVLLCFDYLLIINLAGEHESEPQVVSYQDHVEKKRDSSPVNKAVTLLRLFSASILPMVAGIEPINSFSPQLKLEITLIKL